MYVRAGRPAFARPCVGVYKSISLMSSSLLLQQCPACLVRLTWIVFVIRCRWPYSWCLVGCCRQDLFKIARSILVQLPSSFFSSRFLRVHVVHPYSSTAATAATELIYFPLAVTFIFPDIFTSLARSRYICLFFVFFVLQCDLPGWERSQFGYSLYFVDYHMVWSSGWEKVRRLYFRIP